VVAQLKKDGLNIRIDEKKLKPGTFKWVKETENNIKAASAVVVLLSPDANESVWIIRELNYAEVHNKRIFPVLIRGDETKSIPINLINHQRIDLREDESAGLNQLGKVLKQYLSEEKIIRYAERINENKDAQGKVDKKALDQRPKSGNDKRKILEKVWYITIALILLAAASALLIYFGSRSNLGNRFHIPVKLTIDPTAIITPLNVNKIAEIAQRHVFGNGELSDVNFSPNSKMLASIDYGDDTLLWSVKDLTLIRTIRSNIWVTRAWIEYLAFSPDSQFIFAGPDSKNNIIRMFQINDGKFIRSFPGDCLGMALSPDGKILASSSLSGPIHLWNVSNGNLIKNLEIENNNYFCIRSIAFSNDGQLLAAGSDDKKILLWKVDDGKLIGIMLAHTEFLNLLVFSPNNELLASGSRDGTIRFWNTKDGSLVRTLTINAWVRGLSFSPDGQILASGSDDNFIHFWRVNDGQLLRSISEPSIQSIHFSPEGKILVSGSYIGNIRLWGVVP
jgi:hypothetical protein